MLLEGKKIIIMGVRNKWSIAWGAAQSTYENGAEIIFTYGTMENKEKTTTPEMPDIDVLFELADLFKVFGDSTRLRIMYTISENEMSVLNIAEALSMEQSTISHQLRVLRQNKLVRVRREGKQIYYSLDDDHVKRIIEMGLDHVLE